MGFFGASLDSRYDVKPPRLMTILAVGALILSGLAPSPGKASERRVPGERSPAVARPNLRLGFQYDFFHIDSTETTTNGTTLRVPNLDGHAGQADLIGTVPVWGPLGARVFGRARYGHTQRSLDSLDRGNNEVTSYGAGAELLLRDPGLGSLSAGGGYDRFDGEGSVTADQFNGTASAAIFFPDFGSGPVDWVVRFDFAHRQISGTPGPVDFDADRYTVTGSAGWYLTDDFQLVLGGRWERAEEEFSNEDDREGFMKLRWRIPGRVPLELNLGGSVGVSDYKQTPFRSDNRLAYGATAGLTLRFRSGQTLLESIRHFD